jgi:hypothetical protein
MIEQCHAIPKKGTKNSSIIKAIQNEGLQFIEKEKASINDIILFLENGYPQWLIIVILCLDVAIMR